VRDVISSRRIRNDSRRSCFAAASGVSSHHIAHFLVDLTGRQYAAPVDYPHFFYGFLSVAMAWQLAFLVIGSNPMRFRPLMIPGIIEKLSHVTGVAVLYNLGRISMTDAMAAGRPMLGVLFILALL
jgi:hypothetical protein